MNIGLQTLKVIKALKGSINSPVITQIDESAARIRLELLINVYNLREHICHGVCIFYYAMVHGILCTLLMLGSNCHYSLPYT